MSDEREHPYPMHWLVRRDFRPKTLDVARAVQRVTEMGFDPAPWLDGIIEMGTRNEDTAADAGHDGEGPLVTIGELVAEIESSTHTKGGDDGRRNRLQDLVRAGSQSRR